MIRKIATAFAFVGTAALLAGCAASQVGTAPVVPENLRAPAGQVLSLEAQATGVQIYECNANKTDPSKFEWIFKAPEADLFDNAGRKIGKHYAGPTWESNDGSKVQGEVIQPYEDYELQKHVEWTPNPNQQFEVRKFNFKFRRA